MAKPCKYRLPGQDTWMSEDDFKKSLTDGLLDKFILDDKVSIPALRGFKADATAAEKFKAPVTEAAPKVEIKESGYSPTDNIINKPELTKNKTHGWRTMSEEEFNSLSSGEKTYEGGAPKSGNWIAGVPESAAKFGKKGTVMVEFGGIKIEGAENMEKGSKADKSNVTKVWKFNNDTKKFEEAPELLDKVKKSEKIEAPISKAKTADQLRSEADDIFDNQIPNIKGFSPEFYGVVDVKNNAIYTSYVNSKERLKKEGINLDELLSESDKSKLKQIEQLQQKAEKLYDKADDVESKPAKEPKPTTEKVERKGAVEVEAETKRGTKVTYKAEVSEDGKTASVQQTYEAPFGGETEGPRFANLPVKTDASGNRYVETKNETRVYVDKVKEAPKTKEEATPKEETKTKPATVKILSSKPKLDERGMPIITQFNKDVEFTKNRRTGKWETTDKAGNKIEATEDQAIRAEEALKEQQREERNARERSKREDTKKKISDAFDKLKIDPKGKAFSIPIPIDIYNKIIELAKRSVLAGVDVSMAIKDATNKVLEKRKAQKLISEEEAKKVEDYTNSKEFTDKINEATEGQERVSGIKKALVSEESKEISDDLLDKMTDKEILDEGQKAIENKEIDPDKLISSIIGTFNKETGQYEKGRGRVLMPIETAAMAYYKVSLDNELEIAYEKLNKAIDSKNVEDQGDAEAEVARLEEKIREYEVMSNITGYLQSRSFSLRKLLLNSQYDLVKQKAKIRAQYSGKIPADVEERLNELDRQLRETNAKLAELEKRKAKTEDEEVVKNIKETKDTENKSAVSKDGKIKIPTADIRQAVLNGAATIDEVVDAVRDSVRSKFPKATDRQIRDAITNYGKSRTETKDAIQKKINEMKRVGRLLSELEDIQNGIKKAKNKIKRDALTERERELKEKIKEELAKIPLTDEEIADLKAEKLERFKKTTQKAISDLRKKIDSGAFEKKKIDPLLELDEEAAELRSKREEIKFNFDLEYEKAQRQKMGLKERFLESLGRFLNAPKSLIASLDFSAPFRQGAVFVLSQNPLKTLKQLGKQFEFWWSENSYNQWLNGVKSSEYYPLLKASGLYIAEENAKLSAAEEAFMSNFMNKIPLVGKTRVLKSNKKLWGLDLYGRAERAYTGFLNNLRVQAFLDMAQKMQDAGISPKTNIDEFKSWADYVNNATGRGTGSKNKVGTAFNVSAPALSSIFFSPRFLWSRLNLTGVNPSMYYRMSPMARKQAIKRTLGFFGAATSILAFAGYLASLDDDDDTSVEYDPRSSDFGKLRIGNTRFDILAGTQQVYRTLAQFATGEKKSTTTGEIKKLGEKYGDKTRLGVVGDFFANKFSPIMSTIYRRWALTEPEKEMRKEEGERDSDIATIIKDLTIPLYAQDIDDLSKEHGTGLAALFTFLSINGIGVQNFVPKQKSSQQSTPTMDEFEKELYEDESYDDFEKQEQKMLQGF